MSLASRRVLVVGCRGMLGNAVMRLAPPGFLPIGMDLGEIDITDAASVKKALSDVRPEAVINCAAFTDVDGCEGKFELAMKVNGDAPGILAREAREAGAALLHISTDYVFDGEKDSTYGEGDATAPLSAYGKTKLAGEAAVLASGLSDWRIVRTSWLFGPGGKNFVDTMAKLSFKMESLRVVADQFGRPTYTEDLAPALYELMDAVPGIYHYSNSGVTTWRDFATAVVDELRRRGATVATREIIPITTEEYPRAARPPKYSAMSTDKYARFAGVEPPQWRDALARYINDYGAGVLPAKAG